MGTAWAQRRAAITDHAVNWPGPGRITSVARFEEALQRRSRGEPLLLLLEHSAHKLEAHL